MSFAPLELKLEPFKISCLQKVPCQLFLVEKGEQEDSKRYNIDSK